LLSTIINTLLIHTSFKSLSFRTSIIIEVWSVKIGATNVKLGSVHYASFMLQLLTGIRRGEVLGLRIKDIDYENNLIHIRQNIGERN